MVVLRCCLGDFSLYFLGAVVLSSVLCRLCCLPVRSVRRMTVGLAAAYAGFEFFASVVYHGHLTGLWAVILGILSLGMCLGSLLCLLLLVLFGREKDRRHER